MEPAKVNTTYNPGVSSLQNSGINAGSPLPPKFHPGMPDQAADKFWTYNGSIPPKLMQVRYGEPVLFRLHNRLSVNQNENGGFGIHTISTHEHNGHARQPAEG